MEKKCETCIHWDCYIRALEQKNQGFCKRRSPQVAFDQSILAFHTFWPVTTNNTVCGDYENINIT